MSAEFSQFPQYPRNLAYNLKRLSGTLIKSKLRINSDMSEYKKNSIINFYLPVGSTFENRSLVIYCKGKTNSGTNPGIHFPRGGLHSLIQQMQVTAGSRTLSSINEYNFIYNLLSDSTGYSSIDQGTKRITELNDPSIRINKDAFNGSANSGTATDNYAITNNATSIVDDENIYMCANNFLGFFSQSSVSVIDTNNIGQIKISLTLTDVTALWKGANATVPTYSDYTLSDVSLTIDRISFTDSLYYDLVKSQLENGGLNIGYYDYTYQPFSSVTRSGGSVNISTQINTNSLDQCIFTCRPSDYNSSSRTSADNDRLILSSMDTSSTNFNVTLSTIGTSGIAGKGGAFNNSYYYLRDCAGFLNGSWYINAQPFTQQATAPEVFNNTLQALNYGNIDISSGGWHPGCYNLNRFCRQYFIDVLSLENESSDSNFWVSGLQGNGGSIQVSYNCSFETTSTDTTLSTSIIPVLITRSSKILNIKMGRALDLME